jgi:hypothetical protein
VFQSAEYLSSGIFYACEGDKDKRIKTRVDGHSDYLISRIGDLRAIVMKSSLLWDITPCRPLRVNCRFG